MKIASMQGFSNLLTRFTVRNIFCSMTQYTHLKHTIKHFSRHSDFSISHSSILFFSSLKLPPTELVLLLTNRCNL